MRNKSKSRLERLNSSLKDHTLNLAVARVLNRIQPFRNDGAGVVVLIAPGDSDVADYITPVAYFCFGDLDDEDRSDVGFMFISRSTKAAKASSDFIDDFQHKERLVVLAASREVVPTTVELAADAILDIPPVTPTDFRAACKKVLKLDVTIREARLLVAYGFEQVIAALRPGRSAQDALKRLHEIAGAKNSENRKRPARPVDDTPRLEEMHGYGAAKEWGLQLAKDIGQWQAGVIGWKDVDRGLLLSGPPGTGKTIFAQALAKSCQMHFLPTSLAQWQAKGSLDDLLKQMRSDFQTARSHAPSIIFIDELDSIGDRASFSDRYKAYSVQVVNALLECIDGAGAGPGVVVIGATNYPDQIDPAVRRSGRLDKHVVVPMPDEDDRLAILQQHLPRDFDVREIESLGDRTEGLSGADLAQLARDAKRLARRENRPIAEDDLLAALPELIAVDGDYRRYIAVHEAGHTIAGTALGSHFLGVAIIKQVNPRLRNLTAGVASFDAPVLSIRDRQEHLDQICVLLGGMAAEQLVLGTHGGGAGAGEGGDLEKATQIAVDMETRFGQSEGLFHFHGAKRSDLFLRSPDVVERVNTLLRAQLARATALLVERRALLDKVTAELQTIGYVSPDRFRELEAEFGPE